MDHLIKRWFLYNAPEMHIGPISFALVKNTGVAFGLLRDAGPFIIVGAFIALAFLVWLARGERDLGIRTCYLLVIFGAIGNLADRLLWGFVVDYIDIKILPLFNISDIMISLGFTGIVLLSIIESRKRRH